MGQGKRLGFRCFECNARAHHAHHVVPVRYGGTRTVPLCTDCHEKAHERTISLKDHSRRTREGMAKAKALGKRVSGHNYREVDQNEVTDLRQRGLTLLEIGQVVGVSEATVSRRLKVWGIK